MSKYIHRNEPVPRNSRRGCLCRDGQTYSRECCGDSYFNQGVGALVGGQVSDLKKVLTTRSYGNGSVSPSSVIVNQGNTTVITATADLGYIFSSWNDGNTDNPRTINVNDSTTIYANFIAKNWSDDFTMSKTLFFGRDGLTLNPLMDPAQSGFWLQSTFNSNTGMGYSLTASAIETQSQQNTDDDLNIYNDMTIGFGNAIPSHLTEVAYDGFSTGYIGIYVDNNNFVLLQATTQLLAPAATSFLLLRCQYIRGAGTIDGTTNKIQVGMTISTFGT